jgi:hypothetical protein
MKIIYDCGCEYEFSGRIIGPDDDERTVADYVDDDGYSFELCDKHQQETTTPW